MAILKPLYGVVMSETIDKKWTAWMSSMGRQI